ncbi:MAG: alkene reductase [Phycisphaerales bacterium]|nr:alkene reductase [Phycisphaerales bacterium]
MTTTSDAHLFSPHALGALTLPHRIALAPLTRCRTGVDRVPSALHALYYAQRASAAIIITEATQISPMGVGYAGTPGLHSDAHVEGWKLVTDAVHASGGRVFIQLWHVGRVSHPDWLDGRTPVSSSAVTANGKLRIRDGSLVPFVAPRALTTEEIASIVQEYAIAARNAMLAGADGVEIHAANGYLIDQFLRDGMNQRTDAYGGTIERRMRFLREVTEAVVRACGCSRVGVRLSPTNRFNDVCDSNPHELFPAVASMLNQFHLAYLHVLEGVEGSPSAPASGCARVAPLLREAFHGTMMINGGYDAITGDAAIRSGLSDLVAYGVPFIANPDLPLRYRLGAPITPPQQATWYGSGATGYTDYAPMQHAGD